MNKLVTSFSCMSSLAGVFLTVLSRQAIRLSLIAPATLTGVFRHVQKCMIVYKPIRGL